MIKHLPRAGKRNLAILNLVAPHRIVDLEIIPIIAGSKTLSKGGRNFLMSACQACMISPCDARIRNY